MSGGLRDQVAEALLNHTRRCDCCPTLDGRTPEALADATLPLFADVEQAAYERGHTNGMADAAALRDRVEAHLAHPDDTQEWEDDFGESVERVEVVRVDRIREALDAPAPADHDADPAEQKREWQAEDVYAEVRAERQRAHAKHGPNSMESYPPGAFIRYTILAEEVGEIAKEFNEAEARGGQHTLDLDRLRGECIQVAAMASAWAEALRARPDDEGGA